MKKTYGHYCCQYFKMPALDRSDLEAIEKIIQQEIKPQRYEIAFDGTEYDSVDEIPAQTQRKDSLVIHTRTPGLRLKLSHSWAELYSEDLGTTDPAMQEISEVVAKKQRLTMWHSLKFAPWLAPIVGFASVALTMQLIYLQMIPFNAYYFALALLLLLSGWWAVGYRYSLYHFSSIDLRQ